MPMTPKEFSKEMKRLAVVMCGDKEAMHGEMDALMCKVLDQLGYTAGVRTFKKAPKYYA